ncbi:MAG: hypothetical protein U0457_05365 [Candidatus Sericytochromatia bacterium]
MYPKGTTNMGLEFNFNEQANLNGAPLPEGSNWGVILAGLDLRRGAAITNNPFGNNPATGVGPLTPFYSGVNRP